MTPRFRVLTGRVATALVAIAFLPSLLAAGPERPVDFARDVAPLLERSCVRCHKPDNRKGDVTLTTREGLIAAGIVVPGRVDESSLLDVLTPEVPGRRAAMPKQGDPLTQTEVDVIRRWIREGAPWPQPLVLREKPRADTSWWSLRPLAYQVPPAPAGLPESWGRHPIDRFLGAGLVAKGLSPATEADRRTLIRRLTFDLTGLPPTHEEILAFEADSRSDAYERLVERLLASPRYGEHWGRHWLDVVRFGESTGYERNVILDNAWPFRDYVIRSFNDDKPFDRFVVEHLAGDVIGPGDPAVEVGTAFLVCGPYDNVDNQDPAQAAQIRANTIDDMVRATGEAFLGLTIGCARCHDHKFDPISQRDYYGLYATFAGVNHGVRELFAEARRTYEARRGPLVAERGRLAKEQSDLEAAIVSRADASRVEARWVRPPADRYGTEERFTPLTAAHVRLTVLARDDDAGSALGYQLDEFEVWTTSGDGQPSRNVALASGGARAEGASRVAGDYADAYSPAQTIDGKFGARWIASGPTLTVHLARPERVDRVVFSSDRTRTLAADHPHTRFVGDFRVEVSVDGDHWVEVASSSDRRPHTPAHARRRRLDLAATPDERKRLGHVASEIERVDGGLAGLVPPPSWWIGQFQPAPGPFHVFLGGDPARKGEPVLPASLAAFEGTVPASRLDATAPEPVRRLALARWIVAPENPLTPRVLANRLWHYHFGTGLVDTPSDFGVMGGRPSHPELLDWLARQVHALGWRLKSLHRLIVTSQAYRQASGFRADAARVDADDRLLWRFPPRRLSAEEVRDAMLSVSGLLDLRVGGPGFRLYRYLEDNVATYVPLDRPGPETYRRAVYHQNARAARVDLLTEFDCPDVANAAPRRASTTSPLQALALLNHQFTLDVGEALGNRLRRAAGSDPVAQVELAFRLAFGRGPDATERDAAVGLVKTHGARSLARALFNASEFLFVD
jgi:Protein of unknown function (DUF1553)/Protein of unknown function (DUF1549)/Planctomycete cytochrome C